MTINECFICPVCGKNNVVLQSATALMSDIRVDTMSCTSCEAMWRVYSKVSELQTEIINYPQQAADDTADAQIEVK